MYDEALGAMDAAAETKAELARRRPLAALLHASMAGVYVGFGILLIFLLGAPFSAAGSPATPLVMGATFGIALSLVVFAGSDLFTGNTLVLTSAALRGRISWPRALRATLRERDARIAALQEELADTRAVQLVTAKVLNAPDFASAVDGTLAGICEAFPWAFGSYWTLDPTGETLVLAGTCGAINPEFERLTHAVSFAYGVGVPGLAWKSGELVFVHDLDDLPSFPRRPAARAAGIGSAVSGEAGRAAQSSPSS